MHDVQLTNVIQAGTRDRTVYHCRLQGARIGVLRTFADASTPEVAALFGAAMNDLTALGEPCLLLIWARLWYGKSRYSCFRIDFLRLSTDPAGAHPHCAGATVVDINITSNSLGIDWDGSAGAADSSALAKGVWNAGNGAWEDLWGCQVKDYADIGVDANTFSSYCTAGLQQP